MKRLKSALDRLMNVHGPRRGPDFSFSIFSFLLAAGILCIALVGLALAYGPPPEALVIRAFLGIVIAALLYKALPYWVTGLAAVGVAGAALVLASDATGFLERLAYGDWPGFIPLSTAVALAAFSGPAVQVAAQWEKVVVLRCGKFHAVKGPGLFGMLPLADKFAAVVDTRIRASDFSAEKILTRDTVPVHVDALAFWMIWDAQKAILEVENFLEAVTLSAQTALRDSVGKYSLTTLLTERETLYREIQAILDAKTNPWGITILSVEFVDIKLPKSLEDVMSKVAQAEREKKARLLLAEAERDVAEKYLEASRLYEGELPPSTCAR
jgi:regulator of protease activity HflC (stomatin/prohibitin superfamily)